MDVLNTGLTAGEFGFAGLPSDDVNPMAGLLDEFDRYLEVPQIRRGDIVEGTIVSLSPAEILVDIGGKTEGTVSNRELERMDPEHLASLSVGDEVLASIVRPEGRDGYAVLSLTRAQQEVDWREADKKQRSGEVVTVPGVDANRGGLIVQFGDVRGFIQASQLSSEYRGPGRSAGDDENTQRWRDAIGKQLEAKVLEVDRRRNRLILSAKVVERERQREQKAQLLLELKVGDKRKGVVRSICDFGAFVDIGGADGLVHISELSWRRVRHPSEVVQVGAEVEVSVLNVDLDRRRIGLSMRRTQPEPWAEAEDRYQVGQIVTANVTRLADFGAFALVEGELEGLIHISELAPYRVEHPREVVSEGEEIQVCILRIEPERRRLGLSLSQAQEGDAGVDWEVADDLEDLAVVGEDESDDQDDEPKLT